MPLFDGIADTSAVVSSGTDRNVSAPTRIPASDQWLGVRSLRTGACAPRSLRSAALEPPSSRMPSVAPERRSHPALPSLPRVGDADKRSLGRVAFDARIASVVIVNAAPS